MEVQEKSQAQVADEQKAEKDLLDPWEYLATFANSPSKAQVEAWKLQAPNGIIRLFAQGKRVYLVRGVSGMELLKLQSMIPENLGAGLAPEARASKFEQELNYLVAAQCLVWTSASPTGTLTVEQLKAGSAGLPGTLFNLIAWLSDFVDPELFQVMSAEL